MRRVDSIGCGPSLAAALFTGVLALAGAGIASAQTAAVPAKPSYPELLAASKPGDWRPLDLNSTIYLELAAGRVVIELSEAYAPAHVANIRALVREQYFDGLAIVRSQDNFVVQWGDPDEKNPRPMKQGKKSLAPEFTRSIDPKLPFTRLPDVDGYAPEVGFSNSFPVGRNPKTNQTWLAHCYGMLGAGRNNAPDSSIGAELYVVTGQSPRSLDRQLSAVGRVVKGMEFLSVIPRGPEPMGFYEKPEQRAPIVSIKLASDVPEAQRTPLQLLRTDSQAFIDATEARRNRVDGFYTIPVGHIDLCNVPLPVRAPPAK